MNTNMTFDHHGKNIVYVKPIAASELPPQVQAQVGEVETLYAVHDANGQQLAIVPDQKVAFMLARQNDLAPVQLH